MSFNSISEIVDDFRQGKMVILVDDEDRENEGDLIMAAERISPEAINFMARHACGLICLTLTQERCERLKLPLMVNDNQAVHRTNFTLSIEAASGVTTGISAADRAWTVHAAVAKEATAADIVQPGHIFPLMAQPGGVLSRAGHTEAGCDLARLAGFEPAAVIVEIMNLDGSMARRSDLEQFAKTHQLKMATIADLIHYRILHEKTVQAIGDQLVTTRYGTFRMVTYRDEITGDVHLALVKGEIKPAEATLVRVVQAETFRDVLGVDTLDRKSWSIAAALQYVENAGQGVVVLLSSAESGDDISLQAERIHARPVSNAVPSAPGDVYSTVGTGSQILRDLGVRKMSLLGPKIKYAGLSGFDLEIVEYIDPA